MHCGATSRKSQPRHGEAMLTANLCHCAEHVTRGLDLGFVLVVVVAEHVTRVQLQHGLWHVGTCDVDRAAAKRGLDFEIGWFLKPLVSGHYPKIMRMIAKDRLPKFTPKEKKLVKGSVDFMGLNYYTAIFAKSIPIDFHASPVSSTANVFVNLTAERNGVLIGPPMGGSETSYYLYPKGVQKLLEYMKREFKNPAIYITENGLSETRNDSLPLKVQLNDPSRIDYTVQHLYRIRKAIKNGVNVKGYFYWSLLDGFEWIAGYINRFGLYHIDYNNNLTRTPKDSAKWFKRFLKHHE
ncbi:hypothetical protein EZV62_008994 [Acer yangbiense]|uniref:Beta-glucosidase n=1 Tax=Acer yangbiense TaxID=1000413 RepID=A0A5C7IFF2_9ROSI|nr:hypothetical protein EZV62_008994 [Acer yangbiense]